MPKRPFDLEHPHLMQDLLVTVVKARMEMDAAAAKVDLLMEIFLAEVERPGTEDSFVDRCVNGLELYLLDARDAPALLRTATVDMSRAMWSYRMDPTDLADQRVRKAFERWQASYRQSIGEDPTESYMDLENHKCRTEPDYYSEQPVPFASRVRVEKGN